MAQRNIADADYFHTMQIPVISGRVFSEQDQAGAPPVAIINQTMRARYWPNEDPVGRPLRLLADSVAKGNVTATIVGVVGDIKHYGLDEKSASQIYVAYAQNPFIFATLVVRTQADPMSMSTTVRKAVWTVYKDQPVWKVRTLQSLIDNSVGPRRFMMWLLGGLSALALLLASVGLYGVMSYTVTQRTHEIGIRMALGARAADVMKLVVRNGMMLVLGGVAAGLTGAFVLTRWLATLLFGVTSSDATTFVLVPLCLIVVAILACYVPARRATKVDPLVALRYE